MKLKELVPPVELCKQIPEGEFAGSVFVYFYDANGQNITLDQREGDAIWKDVVLAPAPTLEEIMASFSYCRVYKKSSGKFIACRNKFREVAENGATAALQLWLKVKGGDDE